MPVVNGRKFAYSEKGLKKAKKYAEKKSKPIEAPSLDMKQVQSKLKKRMFSGKKKI